MKSLQLDKPHAVVVIGIQGSGKTFFAKKFAETFNAPFLEESLFFDNAIDSTAASNILNVTLTELLKTGRSIVIEQSLSSRVGRTDLTKLLRTAGYVPLFVWVQVDLDTAMTRAYRTARISQDDYKAAMRKFTPPHASERPLVVSGKYTFATQAKAVLKKLSAPRVSQPSPERRQPVRGQIVIR
ncbi:AAA family ATPase [Candidatus Saccharibacteria bacterium]|nr:AAA family ATPase [Candidatus Saccharibacteria bacterium]